MAHRSAHAARRTSRLARPGAARHRLLPFLALLAALGPLGAQTRQAAPKRTPPAPPAAPRTERPVPFAVGERLSYEIAWSSFITATAATAEITVREKRPAYGSVAYYVVAEGRPTSILAMFYPLYYKADTWLDVYSLLPLRASIFSQERTRRENTITLFDHARGTARLDVETGTGSRPSTKTSTLTLLPQTQDPLSAIFAMRARPLAVGTRWLVPVTLDDSVYQVQVSVDGREMLRTALGTRQAWRITPVILVQGRPAASPRGMTLWFSDDARRLPLKMEVELPSGRFDLVLTAVK